MTATSCRKFRGMRSLLVPRCAGKRTAPGGRLSGSHPSARMPTQFIADVSPSFCSLCALARVLRPESCRSAGRWRWRARRTWRRGRAGAGRHDPRPVESGAGDHSCRRHRGSRVERADPRAGRRSAERRPLRGRPGSLEGPAALHARSAAVPGGAAAGARRCWPATPPRRRTRPPQQARYEDLYKRGLIPRDQSRNAGRQRGVAPGDACRRSGGGRDCEAEPAIHAHRRADFRTHRRARRPHRGPGARQRHHGDGRDQSADADLRDLLGPRTVSDRHSPVPGADSR